jgi:hypothetical protein
MNRDEERLIVESLARGGDLSAVDVRGLAKIGNLDAVFPALIALVAGFVCGVGLAQWLVDGLGRIPASWAIGSGMGLVSYSVFYFGTLSFSSSRIRADYYDDGEHEEPPPTPADAFIRTERRKQLVKLPGKMRGLLTTFASFYNEVGTTAIGAWYESGHLVRADIEAVRDYLVEIGAATKDSRGYVSLTPWTVNQLARWAGGDYAGLVELLQDSPTPVVSE